MKTKFRINRKVLIGLKNAIDEKRLWIVFLYNPWSLLKKYHDQILFWGIKIANKINNSKWLWKIFTLFRIYMLLYFEMHNKVPQCCGILINFQTLILMVDQFFLDTNQTLCSKTKKEHVIFKMLPFEHYVSIFFEGRFAVIMQFFSIVSLKKSVILAMSYWHVVIKQNEQATFNLLFLEHSPSHVSKHFLRIALP